jgi:hypothetical protein
VAAAPAVVYLLNRGSCDRSTDVRASTFVEDVAGPLEPGAPRAHAAGRLYIEHIHAPLPCTLPS